MASQERSRRLRPEETPIYSPEPGAQAAVSAPGYNGAILGLMQNAGDRQIEQMRYMTRNTTDAIRANSATLGNAIGNLAGDYQKGAEFKSDSEEANANLREKNEDIRSKQLAYDMKKKDDAFMDERMENGRTRREQMYMNKEGYKGTEEDYLHDNLPEGGNRWQQDYQTDRNAKSLDMDQRRALIKKYLAEEGYNREALDLKKRQLGAEIGDKQADNRRLDNESSAKEKHQILEDLSHVYRNAKDDPAKLAEADAIAKQYKLTDKEIAVAKNLPDKGAKGTSTPRPTEGMLKASGFYDKAMQANNITKLMEESGYDPSSGMRNLRDFPGTKGAFMNPDDRKYRQAQDQFILAVLRDESGANTPHAEIEKYRETYFPKVFDDAGTRLQKAAARQQAVETLKNKGAGITTASGESSGGTTDKTKAVGEMSMEELERELRGK